MPTDFKFFLHTLILCLLMTLATCAAGFGTAVVVAPTNVITVSNSSTIFISGNGSAANPYEANVSTVPLSSLPTGVVTNLSTQPIYRLYIFQSGYGTNHSIYTNGVWTWQGLSPTNIALTSRTPMFQDTNTLYNNTIRDPSVFQYGGQFIMTWSHYGTGTNKTDGVGMATSPDGISFTFLGYASITNSLMPNGSMVCWSPVLFTNTSGGLESLMSLGNTVSAVRPTNYFIADVNPANYLLLSNFRPLNITNWTDSGTHYGGAKIYAFNGMYYFFSQTGTEYTNSALTTYGWTWMYPTNAPVSGGAMPTSISLILLDGIYYLIGSSLGSQGMPYLTSTDLVHWNPDQNDPNVGGALNFVPHPTINEASGDGTMIAITVPNTGATGLGLAPQNYLAATGASPLDGGALTNLNAAHLTMNGMPGLNRNISIQTNPVGPHGIILQIGGGIITNTSAY